MKLTADTNVLVRAVVLDDPKQASIAAKVLSEASLIAVSLASLCELVWVLRSVYAFTAVDAASAIHSLVAAKNVMMDRLAAEAGLVVLEAGGDFADGVIAYEGKWLGGETLVSFDKKAVSLLAATGQSVRCL